MTDPGKLKITTPTDREIAMTRVFHAPRQLVFDAWTKPELLQRWLGVFGRWSLAVCEVDLRVGGRYRFIWRSATDGAEMGMGGEYTEVVPGERIVNTELFDDPWYPGGAQATTVFVEQGGKTTVTNTIRYATKEARDGVLQSPMETGISASYDLLETILAPAAAR